MELHLTNLYFVQLVNISLKECHHIFDFSHTEQPVREIIIREHQSS